MRNIKGKKENHLSRKCVFCKWMADPKKFQKEEHYRILEFNSKKPYFVILDLKPKAVGHTLIISKKAYDDITDLWEEDTAIFTAIFEGIIEWAYKIKVKLKPKKVYILSMCDHWSEEELPKDECTTEHLHFQLIPRYEFDKDKRGESLLTEKCFYQTCFYLTECFYAKPPPYMKEILKNLGDLLREDNFK